MYRPRFVVLSINFPSPFRGGARGGVSWNLLDRFQSQRLHLIDIPLISPLYKTEACQVPLRALTLSVWTL